MSNDGLAAARARAAAYAKHAQYDPKESTRNARAAFLQRFVDQVDPDRELPEAERIRRAEAAKKAYMIRLAVSSARARRRKADGDQGEN